MDLVISTNKTSDNVQEICTAHKSILPIPHGFIIDSIVGGNEIEGEERIFDLKTPVLHLSWRRLVRPMPAREQLEKIELAAKCRSL